METNGRPLTYQTVAWMQKIKDKSSGKEYYTLGPVDGMTDTLAVTPDCSGAGGRAQDQGLAARAGEEGAVMDERKGIPAVCEAVTFAAALLAQLKRNTALDDRTRNSCEMIQRMLERAETILYGH